MLSKELFSTVRIGTSIKLEAILVFTKRNGLEGAMR
jgi:hypothetical protein